MGSVCDKSKCTACMACVDACQKNAISVVDHLKYYVAMIDETKCINCGACRKVCQNLNPVLSAYPEKWFQGWALDKKIREEGSSGGFATSISKAFIEDGGVLCSCKFLDGQFKFHFSDNVGELEKFCGSKYVKSNPIGIYKEIRRLLSSGKKVLLIALPCQVAAAKNYVGNALMMNFYSIDLICHGTPSFENLNIFLKQYGCDLKKITDISFRKKSDFKIRNDVRDIAPKGVFDKYTLAFLNSINYTENCYNCQYAKIERVSDLTIGDSWGSDLCDEEKRKGISLALCMNEKGKYLLDNASIKLERVDLKNAIAHNHQLEIASKKPKGYDVFFNGLENNIPYNKLVEKALPKQCFNQKIKAILYKILSVLGGEK